MSYLEDWSHIEKHHSSALSAAIKALKASTLRLPVVDGAKADVHGVKEAVNSAVDVMHTMTSSKCNLLSKVCIYIPYLPSELELIFSPIGPSF